MIYIYIYIERERFVECMCVLLVCLSVWFVDERDLRGALVVVEPVLRGGELRHEGVAVGARDELAVLAAIGALAGQRC